LAIEDIDHIKIKTKIPQTNGICKRFHHLFQDKFYAIAFQKRIYCSILKLQVDLDRWMDNRTTSGHIAVNTASEKHWRKLFSKHLACQNKAVEVFVQRPDRFKPFKKGFEII